MIQILYEVSEACSIHVSDAEQRDKDTRKV